MAVHRDPSPREESALKQRQAPTAQAPEHLGAARVLDLQRSMGNTVVSRLLAERPPPGRLARLVRDQHAGTHAPSARQLSGIEKELNPTAAATTAGPAPAWDGDAANPDHVANRAALKTELTAALTEALDAEMPGIRAEAAAPVVPLTTFEGPGRAAKRVVDGKFGAYTSQAALTSPHETARSSFSFAAGVNLLDVSDPAVRPPEPADAADWMAQTDRKAQRVQRRHHFNKDRSTDEEDFLANDVLAPFVAARLADLELFDRFGFAMADEGQVFIVPRVQGSRRFPATAPASGGPSPAERKQRWSMWQTLVHEYIHTLEHPEFVRARGSNRILFEGFCEMFTEEVLREWIPKARADSDAALRAEVEGTNPAGARWPGFRRSFVDSYDPGSYADFARRAKRIRSILGAGGENAVRAAFFQGHLELLGLQPGGGMAAAPTAPADEVTVPAGIATIADLAAMTGVSVAALKRANASLRGPAATVAAGDRVRAPGCRFHVVVAAQGSLFGLIPLEKEETIDQIAAQNGVTPADLRRANPGLDFAALSAGDRVLIPRH